MTTRKSIAVSIEGDIEGPVRPDKGVTRQFVLQTVPEYAGMLRDFQREGHWLRLPRQMLNIRDNLKVHNYVELYEDERLIVGALYIGLLGKEGCKEFSSEVSQLSRQEQREFLNELAMEVDDFNFSVWFPPESEDAQKEAKRIFEKLSETERAELTKRAQFFWAHFFASFHNFISLMVHGEKLTSLVPKAMAGDQEAFCKAIQIDRSLVVHHPFFRQRRLNAHGNGESEFLTKIAYRESNPTLRGKIRYPGLYMVFALLESTCWLEDFTHGEILDLCDEAGLDQYQNRIEDVNYLTKRLLEYRRLQKSGGLSMQ